MGHGRFNKYQYVYADKIRNMNDEEYSEFKNKMETRSCCYSPKTESTKATVWPIVNRVIKKTIRCQSLKEKGIANAIKNKTWSYA